MELNSSIAAVVTGGASGLGEATARALAKHGVKVAIFDLQKEKGEKVATEIGGTFCEVNITTDDSVAAGFKRAREAHGQERILVNCAGTGNAIKTASRDRKTGGIRYFQAKDFDRIIQINLVGTFRCIAMSAAGMLSLEPLDGGERGVIVNTASVAGMVGLPKRASYSASKGAVIALTRQVAVEYVEQGIRVNCLCPGTVDSPWVGRLLQEAADPVAARQALVARQPLGRLGTPDEIAAAALYLVSDDAAFITGTGLVIDGGLTAR